MEIELLPGLGWGGAFAFGTHRIHEHVKWWLYTTKFGMFGTQHGDWNREDVNIVGQNLGIWCKDNVRPKG